MFMHVEFDERTVDPHQFREHLEKGDCKIKSDLPGSIDFDTPKWPDHPRAAEAEWGFALTILQSCRLFGCTNVTMDFKS